MVFPPILLQPPPPCADGRNDSSMVRVVVSWPPEPHVPKLDVSLARKNLIWLQIVHPPFPLVPLGPPCPGRLFAWLAGHELP